MLFLPNIILSHNCHIFISPGQDQHEKTGHYTFSLRFSRIEYYILRFDEPGLIRYGSIFPRYSTIYEKRAFLTLFSTPFGQYNHISRTIGIQVLLYAFMCFYVLYFRKKSGNADTGLNHIKTADSFLSTVASHLNVITVSQ